MRDLNIDFLDLYKRVDRFIRDAYASSEGVSEYLRQMEHNAFKGRILVSTWATDYNQLKRLRGIRNQLSHEVGYDADLCEEADVHWLEDFRSRLYAAGDPLAVLRMAEKAEQKRYEEEQRHHQEQKQKQQVQTIPQPQRQPPHRRSLLREIIKKIFSRRS
ncbi:MAG: hypothetical protein J5789_09390 [Oscillospiraceae bacterium]|nr:hypothetical protein [Oscillospiraceae bacterium]